MTIHLNQKSVLYEKYQEHFNLDWDLFSEKIKDITYQKYQYLLALAYNHKINDMRLELIKLGVSL